MDEQDINNVADSGYAGHPGSDEATRTYANEEEMIGKGLTDDDNKMISLSMASTTPIRVN